MFKLFNSYFLKRQNLPSAGKHTNFANTSTNNFITARGGTTLGQGQMRTTRPDIGSYLRVQLKPKGLGWLQGMLLAGRAFFGVCFQGNEQSLLANL